MMGRVRVTSSSRLLLTVLFVTAFGLGAVRAQSAAPETLTVNTLNDSADSANNCGTSGTGTVCSLRDAINQANADGAGDTIQFGSGLTGTITLGSSLPAINVSVTIMGPMAHSLTVSGNNSSTVGTIFTIGAGTVSISGLTVASSVGNCGGSGYDYGGGVCINSSSTLTVSNSTFLNNSSGGGGAIFSQGNLTVINCTFSGNSSPGHDGGAIASVSGSITVTNSTFVGNNSPTGGAIYIQTGSSLTAANNLFVGNSGDAIFNNTGTVASEDNNVFYNNTTSDANFTLSNSDTTGKDTKLLPLGYYGGSTETYLPQPGSAAICKGSSAVTGLPTVDQRGFALVNACVDAGAVQTNYIQVTNSGDSNGANCPTKCTLRAAIAQAAGQGDIDFSGVSSATLSTGTLTLSLPASGAAGVNIIGPGARSLTVNGGGSSSNFGVFAVDAGVPAVLYGMTISNGNAAGAGTASLGGGIENAGNLTLLSCAVTGNMASDGGGIDTTLGGTALVQDSTISGNTASGSGGGIFNSGTTEIEESTVSGNSANSTVVNTSGGGIASNGALTVVSSTITNNTASGVLSGAGGGIDGAGGSTSLSNTIVSGNTANTSSGGVNSNINGTYTGTGNVIGGNTDTTNTLVGGTGAVITLSSLGYNPSNASLQTQTPLPGSAAICAGLSTNLLAGVTTDERGQPNENTTYSGYSTSTPCVDAGAVQTNYSMSFTTSPTSVTVDQTFGGMVTLDESGNPFAGVAIPAKLSSGTLYGTGVTGGTATAETDSSGHATYAGLYTTNGSGLTLNASLPLTATLLLSATSSPSFDVTTASTTLALTASTLSPKANELVTFTATISPNVTTNFVGTANETAINGTVVFEDGGTAISGCSAEAVSYSSTSSSYVATCSTAALTGGAHSNITASFTSSDSNYAASNGTAGTVTVAQATTTTAVTSSSASNTSNVDDSVTFTATITASAGAVVPLSGTVTFTDNGNTITSCGTSGAVTVSSWNSTTGTAIAACQTSALIGGKHTIVATYGHDTSYSGSNNNLTQLVNALNTLTTATTNPTSATVNQSVTLSATVAPLSATTQTALSLPQPVALTGPVTFTEGGNAVPGCTVTWNASTGAASCSTSQLTVGQHTITATYPTGDPSYNTSSSSVAVAVGAATGTMSLASSNTQSTVNSQVTFAASFTVANGNTKPSGQIEFSYTPSGSTTATDFSGCSAVGLTSTSNISNTKTYSAQCSSSSLVNGTYTITAKYINDTNFNISPATLTQTVGPASTTTQVTSSSSTSQVNQSVTFTATVTSQVSGSITPSGTVSFTDSLNGSTAAICSNVAIASGVYSCTTSSLLAGTQTITATFTPSDKNFQSSNGTVTQLVDAASSSLGLTASSAAVVVKNPNNLNDSVTFMATVKVNGNSTKPSGSITFTYNGALLIPECPVAVPVDANGTATCTTTSLPAGLDTINAAYGNDSNFTSSTFSVAETVEDYSLGISAVPTDGGPAETSTVTVTQGYSSSNDPFAPVTIGITPTSVQSFSGSLGLNCAVTVQSAPSGSVAPACNLATSTLAVAGTGTQQSAGLVVDATNAGPGLYTMTVTGTDSTTGLTRTTSINIFVSATGGPLNLVSGSTTGNQATVNFLLPANVSLSNLRCVSVSGTGIQPPGVPPSALSISCNFSPTTIPSVSALQSGQVTVTVMTGGTATAANDRHTNMWAAGLFGVPLFGLVGLLRGRKSPRSVFFRVIAILALCTASYQVMGCGGSFQKPASTGGQTPPGSYTMLIQGTGSDGHTYQAILRLNITL